MHKESSEILRAKGNEAYKKKKLDSAVHFYHRALSECNPNYLSSSELPLCLGNLSAALFERNNYAASFSTAKLALECPMLPDANRQRIMKRCAACLDKDPLIVEKETIRDETKKSSIYALYC